MPGVVARSQELLDLLEVVDGTPLPDGFHLSRVWHPTFPGHNLAEELDLRLKKLHLVDSQGEPDGNANVKELLELGNVLDDVCPGLRKVLLVPLPQQVVVLLGWHTSEHAGDLQLILQEMVGSITALRLCRSVLRRFLSRWFFIMVLVGIRFEFPMVPSSASLSEQLGPSLLLG